MIFNRNTIAGLHITDTNINLIILHAHKRQVRIKQWISQTLPKGAVVNGLIQQPSLLQTTLKTCLKQSRIRRLKTVLALPMYHITWRRLHIPMGLTPNEQEAEIIAQLQHTHEMSYDFFPITTTEHQDFQEMMIVMTQQAIMQSYVHVARNVGLNVIAVDADIYAYWRTLHMVDPVQATSLLCENDLLETSAQPLESYLKTSIVLNRNGLPSWILSRDLLTHTESWPIAFGLAMREIAYAHH